MPDLDAMIEEAKVRDGLSVVDPMAVVKPGAGVAPPAPKYPKVVSKKGETSEEETALVRSICARMMKSVEHSVSLSIELAKLREMVRKRGDNWTAYREANLKNPKTGEPYAERTIREYVKLGAEGEGDPVKVEKLFYAHKVKKAKVAKQVRKKAALRSAAAFDDKPAKDPNAKDKVMVAMGKKLVKDAVQVLKTLFQKGKHRADGDTVTVTFATADYDRLITKIEELQS